LRELCFHELTDFVAVVPVAIHHAKQVEAVNARQVPHKQGGVLICLLRVGNVAHSRLNEKRFDRVSGHADFGRRFEHFRQPHFAFEISTLLVSLLCLQGLLDTDRLWHLERKSIGLFLYFWLKSSETEEVWLLLAVEDSGA